jgi:TPR repeat protein
MSAEKGYMDGLFAVGECYYLGTGVEKDLQTTAEWYRKALDVGFVPRDDEEAEHLNELIPDWVDNRST